MTSPGGIPNLPPNAFSASAIGTQLQGITSEKMRQRAGARFPSIFSTSPGGDALDPAKPFGVVTAIFGSFLSTVANADPELMIGKCIRPSWRR